MTTEKTRKLISLLLAFNLVFGIVFPAMPNIVHAKESSFAESNVLDDLLSSTANGAAFDITDFPYNEYGSVQLLQLVEYCYSYRANMQQDYALYLYVYNPTGKSIDTQSAANAIQMAVAYDSLGNPTRYEKFALECVSVSGGDYKNLFYKFRVVDKEIDGKSFADRVNTNERRYDISGMELLTTGNTNATEYHVGGTYTFTGFAAGYGPDESAKSTLSCTSQNLETLSLEVHHTNYRTGVSSLGKYHYNEVHTVYFSIPERVFEEYGNLQKIHAQWWEYKTKMAAITADEEFYNQLLQYVGTDVGEYDASVPVRLYCDYSSSGISPLTNYYGWTYNVDLSRKYNAFGGVASVSFADRISTIMPYAFYTGGETADSVDAETVKAWIYLSLLFDKNNLAMYASFLAQKSEAVIKWAAISLLSMFLFAAIAARIYDTPNTNHNKDTMPLRIFLWAASKTFWPLKKAITGCIAFLKDYRFILTLWAILWCFHLNLMSILISFFSSSRAFSFLVIFIIIFLSQITFSNTSKWQAMLRRVSSKPNQASRFWLKSSIASGSSSSHFLPNSSDIEGMPVSAMRV